MSGTPARQQRLLGPLLGLAVALGLAVLPASSAQAAPTEPTSLTMALKRGGVSLSKAAGTLYGVYWDGVGPAIAEDTVRVSGTLSSSGAALAGRRVALYRQFSTASTAVRVTSKLTGADGTYAFTPRVLGTADYSVRFEGDETYLPVESAAKRLPAMRDFNARKRRVSGRTYFRGVVHPHWGGHRVVLQRQRCGSCAWRTVAHKAAGARGRWSFRVSYPKRVGPVWHWQAVLAPAGKFTKSYSAELTTRRVYTRDVVARTR